MQKKPLTINKYGKYGNRRNKKTTKKLFGKLTKDSNSLFYSSEKINRNLLNKEDKSIYKKDKVFGNIFDEEDKKIPPRISIKAPFELFHEDIANIKFSSKSAVDPHYCLLCVDLFSSKIYTYLMKKEAY